MTTRLIDGRRFAQQPDGTWAPTQHQLLLDSDRAAALGRQVERQRIEREVARTSTHQPRHCGADLATGLLLGALIF